MIRGTEWQEDALCRDPDLGVDFYSNTAEEIDKAKAICDDCPVKMLCLKTALDNQERWGVWGGVDSKELKKVLAIDSKGKRFVHATGPIRCPNCGPRSTKYLVVIEKRRTNTHVQCTNCDLEWITKKLINKKATNF